MDFRTLAQLPFSPDRGWPRLLGSRPDVARLFALVVLPLAAIPPVMVYLAGTHPPEAVGDRFAGYPWGMAAAAFYVAEIATFLAMGWLVRTLARVAKLAIDYPRAYLVAAVAAAPTWLSAIGLALPGVVDVAAVVAAGLALTCRMLYVGIVATCRVGEPLVATSIVHAVIGAALVGWAFLLVLAAA